ncbi:hypothetical protein GTY54_08295 [Streptomyces sp. SID625]|nr:hypothetical protein [Streptomyces sp. SID625]
MKFRRAVVSGITSAVALTALGFVPSTAQAAPATAANTCSEAVATTKEHLTQAGSPTDADDWQSVRDAAQDFVDSHPDGGAGTEALRRDINDLSRLCAP